MTRPRILIAGIGNIFLGDDAFGVEVAQRLARRPLPEEVRVVDFGIRGLDLTYALLDGYESVILVDAVSRGGPPGTLYVLELELDDNQETKNSGTLLEMHHLDPAKVLRLAASMGTKVERLLLVGCEPAETGGDVDIRDGLSDPVRWAVDQAVPLIESLTERLLRGEKSEPIKNPILSP
ncbi:MAG TPA: hydrogenase maturation protease [Gemmataceae bacterium]|nr:hydrogenase maturation protease [Gemmataceae bacterium]